jgi:fructose-bisphosphate aldolase class II
MRTLREYVADAEARHVALGHFNISNIEGFWAIVRAAKALNLPVIIGVSEGERDFIGVKQVRALVTATKEELDLPIFLNADHTYSFERVKEAVDAGFDSVIFDGAKLSMEDNIAQTRECVEYAKSKNPDMLVEGELGYIGQSSKLLDAIPEGVDLDPSALTSPEHAKEFVDATGVDMLAPAVGNFHGMLKVGNDPRLDIPLVKSIREAVGIPLVLHGGSGNVADDFTNSIKAGIAIVHINTEIRVAYRDALRLELQENPDEVAPYKIMKPSVLAMQKVVDGKLRLFNGIQ